MFTYGLFGKSIVLAFLSTAMIDSEAADSKQFVLESIKAHGGKENLAKFNAIHVVFEGVVQTEAEGKTNVTGELWSQPPGKRKIVMIYNFEKTKTRKLTKRGATNGSAWTQIDNAQPNTLKDSDLKEEHIILFVSYASRLLPLIEDKALSLSQAEICDIDNKKCVKITVSRKDKIYVDLYFDKESKLLIKTDRHIRELGDGKRSVEYLGDYKMINGVMFPMKKRLVFDGQSSVEIKCTRVESASAFPDAIFARPDAKKDGAK